MPLSPTGLRNTPGDFFKTVLSQLTPILIYYSKKFLHHYCYQRLIFRLCRVCFEEFGDSVKFWITLNEPKETSLQVDYLPLMRCRWTKLTMIKCSMVTSLQDQGKRGAIMIMTIMRANIMMVVMIKMTTTTTIQS